MTELARELKKYGSSYSRSNLYNYVQELKDKGLVTEMLATKKKGKRVPKLLYATEDADPIKMKYWKIFNTILQIEEMNRIKIGHRPKVIKGVYGTKEYNHNHYLRHKDYYNNLAKEKYRKVKAILEIFNTRGVK
jgi:hypothetical protein